MAVTLGHNQYGKAETRVVRVYRDSDPHEIVDYNVSAALSGDFADTHLTGDNALVLTTDAVKNTVNAYAKEQGEAARQPESFGLALARHFVGDNEQVTRARVNVEMYPWVRLDHDGSPHPHAFARHGGYVRTATVTCDGDQAWMVSGVDELIVLKTTDSEFWGYYQDKYTTLKPTNDRIMATKAKIQWWHSDADDDVDWGKSYDTVLGTLTSAFAGHHSLALQQTIYAMGEAVLESEAGIAEIRFSLPNKHHFVIDLSPFGLDNPNEVFHADDRPYGLIEATVRRDDAPDPGLAFDPGIGW
jgi:urate oxidase